MSTIQKTYNCFIVFDSNDMTISAYTMDDLLMSNDHIVLTWDNSVKSLQKTHKDSSTYTAMRVHTSDDKYGLGMINPTGNNIVYSFDNIFDKLNFKPNGSQDTLQSKLQIWDAAYKNNTSAGTTSNPTAYDYREKGKQLIKNNMEMVELSTRMRLRLTDYLTVREKINMYLKEDGLFSELLPETPPSISDVNNRSITNCHSSALRRELRDAVKAYRKALSAYNTRVSRNKTYTQNMKDIAKKFTLDPKVIYSGAYLTQNERMALAPFIKVGSWKQNNATFSDTYSSDDIYDTLIDVYWEVRNDLQNRLGKPSFDFKITTNNIAAIREIEGASIPLFVGHQYYLFLSEAEKLTPILLQIHIDYGDDTKFSLSFTTDMKRTPLQFRFADLYSTISQTSVTSNAFTFDT